MAYADITINDPNPVKRWLQQRRFSDAASFLRSAEHNKQIHILDFGAGDGEFICQIYGTPSIEAYVYEPNPTLMMEAKSKLVGFDKVIFIEKLSSIKPETFNYIFCLEVFEHLPEKETVEAIREIDRMLKPNGTAVIGVPHELFLPAAFKGLFRMFRRYGDFDATPRNILRATLGSPPLQRPTNEISPGLTYHPHHLGFDYRTLEHILQAEFQLEKKKFSPFPLLGAILNSEVYFALKKAT